MLRPKRLITVICITFWFITGSVIHASDKDILSDPAIKESIKVIEKSYVKAVDVTSLEKQCIDAIHREVLAQSPIDVCMTGMITSLDEYSSYHDKSEYLSKAARNVKPPIVTSLYDGEIAYIAIPQFLEKLKDQILNNLSGLFSPERPFVGLIIDLRDCPGGLLISSVEVAELFLQKSAVISEVKSQSQVSRRKFISKIQPLKDEKLKIALKSVPIIVLVNKNTARGAEVLAAALAENGRAIIIGNATAKRGDVQTVIPVLPEKFMLLTSGYLVDPNGHLISENGVKIHIKVDEKDLPSVGLSRENDPVIKQAYTVLKSQMNKMPEQTTTYKIERTTK